MSSGGKIPRVPRPAARPRGPALYQLGRQPRRGANLFLSPPAEFATATTSAQEWIIYLALALVTRSPADPTQGPFVGGDRWTYQQAIEGGRVFRGGQVVDFVYDQTIGIRTQTTYWHLQQGSDVYFHDLDLQVNQTTLPTIINLWDNTYLPVGDGAAACRVVALAIKRIQLPDPYQSGTASPEYLGVA